MTPKSAAEVTADELDAVLDACRSLVAVAAASLEPVAGKVDLVQLRILVLLDAQGTTSLSDLAAATGLHMSTASRSCDRLVKKGFISRADNPDDRRTVQLTVTPAGQDIVAAVAQARRDTIAPVLGAMSITRRSELVRALRAFGAAGRQVGSVIGLGRDDAESIGGNDTSWVEQL